MARSGSYSVKVHGSHAPDLAAREKGDEFQLTPTEISDLKLASKVLQARSDEYDRQGDAEKAIALQDADSFIQIILQRGRA